MDEARQVRDFWFGKLPLTAEAVDEARLRLAGLSVPAFPVTASDLMQLGLKPGPHLGAELKRLERRWIESGFALDRGTLLDDVGH